MTDHTEILRALDFNAVHSGDAVARVYFKQAAEAIRLLEGDRDHWQNVAHIERARAQRNRVDCLALQKQVADLTPVESTDAEQRAGQP